MPHSHLHHEPEFRYQLPYGAILHEEGVQFSVFSRSATAMSLLLYNDVGEPDPGQIIEFRPHQNQWGDIWSIFVPGLTEGQLYHFQAQGPYNPEKGNWFDHRARLIDPYAKALTGNFQTANDGIVRPPKCVVVDDYFDWSGDRHLRRNLSESVIYEMHVRGFTKDPTSQVQSPGTYLGILEKIPYLKELGVTAVELMPVHEFPIFDFSGKPKELPNYWGYDPLAFFSPHRGYSDCRKPGGQVKEFKEMVKGLHQAGIEVILDVVFNHTCEGNEKGPVLSMKGLENNVYYMTEQGGAAYKNYSGCGNTVNGNHPVVREMIFHCLRYWVHNFHIDGFRFDLASILSRDREGNLLPNPPLIEAITEDPLLADTKFIAEAWDAAGAYQVGSFGVGLGRWAEWNGRYRDDIRRFWRGEEGHLGDFATRITGSSDLYESSGRRPFHSINFITSHDGFTLADLVTYKEKRNLANGEENRDGENNNHSDNYGHEGPLDEIDVKGKEGEEKEGRANLIHELRERQIRNMFATLFLSQGVPMFVAGDEFRRTQQGNNNAYCQDNKISWIDWRFLERHREIFEFVKNLAHFRRWQPIVRRPDFSTGSSNGSGGLPDVLWFDRLGNSLNWEARENQLICLLSYHDREKETKARQKREVLLAAHNRPTDEKGPEREVSHLLLLVNATGKSDEFFLPNIVSSLKLTRLLDTAARGEKTFYPNFDGPTFSATLRQELLHYSMQGYVVTRERTVY
ncbi:MAG: glycogen debranching protein GlgX [Pirellulaceae bacterium]|nr:glycogen debranching protein GlgX [Pirellulaceae bacterium]